MNNKSNLEDIYNVGVIARITNLLELPNDTVRITIEGLNRIKVDEFFDTEELFTAKYSELIDNQVTEIEAKALNRKLLEQRSEEHTSELSHVAISYAVFCLKKKKNTK